MIRLNLRNYPITGENDALINLSQDSFTNFAMENDLKKENRTCYSGDITEEEFISAQNILKTYKDFILKIKELSEDLIPSAFIIYNNEKEKEFYIFQDAFFKIEYSLFCIYQPENEIIYNYIKELFRITDEVNWAQLNSTFENNFKFLSNWQVLEVLLAKKYLESQNKKPFMTYSHKSKNGKIRQITAPDELIKKPLRNLNNILQGAYDGRNEKFQIAYKKGKNVKTGAEIHKNHKYVFNLDIHDFYPSCKKELVEKYIKFLFVDTYNGDFLKKEFLNAILQNDALFIGSPISGTLANAILSKSVYYLYNICKKYNIAFSIYADDITFSSDKFLSEKFVCSLFDIAFSKYELEKYFSLNTKKSIGFIGAKRKITGVAINENNELTVPRKYYRTLRTKINHLANGDTSINIQKLRGQIAYATMLDDSGKIYNYLIKYRETIKKYKLISDEKFNEMSLKFQQKGTI